MSSFFKVLIVVQVFEIYLIMVQSSCPTAPPSVPPQVPHNPNAAILGLAPTASNAPNEPSTSDAYNTYNTTLFELNLPFPSCNSLSVWTDNKLTIVPGDGNEELFEIDLSSEPASLAIISKAIPSIYWNGARQTYATSSDGIIYYQNTDKIIQKFDTKTLELSSTGIYEETQDFCMALDEVNSILYITGGTDSGSDRVLKCVISTSESECQSISSMNIARQAHVCQFYDNKLYVFSGYAAYNLNTKSIEVLDTSFDSNKWELLPAETSINRFRGQSILNAVNEKVIILGGYTLPESRWLRNIEIFDIQTQTMDEYTGYILYDTQRSSTVFNAKYISGYIIGGGLDCADHDDDHPCLDKIQLITFPETITPSKPAHSTLFGEVYGIIGAVAIAVICMFVFIIFFYCRKKKYKENKALMNNGAMQVTRVLSVESSPVVEMQEKQSEIDESKSASQLFGVVNRTTAGSGSGYGSFQPTNVLETDDIDVDDPDDNEDMYTNEDQTEGVIQTPQ